MAKPTALTELGGSKIVILADATATTPAAKAPVAVQASTSGESTYPVGWQGIATHRDGDTLTQPGGFTGLSTAAAPMVVVGVKVGQSGTTAGMLHTDTTTPGGSDAGLVVRNIPTGTQAVSGTVTITPSGTQTVTGTVTVTSTTANQGTNAAVASAWPIKVTDATNTAAVKAASTASAATDPSLVIALSPNSPVPAGTAMIGGAATAGWDHTNRVPVYGTTTSNPGTGATLSSPGNIPNLTDVVITYYAGSTAPSAGWIEVGFGAGTAVSTIVTRLFILPTAQLQDSHSISFTMPCRGSSGNNVNARFVQTDGSTAGTFGTSGSCFIRVNAYATTT